jgi:hypothetical protein
MNNMMECQCQKLVDEFNFEIDATLIQLDLTNDPDAKTLVDGYRLNYRITNTEKLFIFQIKDPSILVKNTKKELDEIYPILANYKFEKIEKTILNTISANELLWYKHQLNSWPRRRSL